ncbi:MAG: hypothetical protein J7K54_05075 [Candidatus Aenigmarchaeota archaeon]|nr:hypothetical protein [Candidatus Aenigmarchaeota archaeon]
MKNRANADRLLFFALGLAVASAVYANTLIAWQLTGHTVIQTKNSKGAGITSYLLSQKTIPIVAVNSVTDEGVVGKLMVKTIPGSGNVLIETNPFLEPDTQYSVDTAVRVARKIAGAKEGERDFILTFNVSSRLIGGPSAGAAIATAAVAAIENRDIRNDVAMTGTIDSDGRIGMVGGILEKAKAASEAGYRIFLIPKGQSKITYYEKRVEKEPFGFGFYLYNTYYVPRTVDITQEVRDKWGLKLIEVSDINEVLNIALE